MTKQTGTAFLERLIRQCGAETEITAAFVGGPLAFDQADPYPELDLYLIARGSFRSALPEWLEDLGEVAHFAKTPEGGRIVTPDGLTIRIFVGEQVPPGVKPIFYRAGAVPSGETGQPAVGDLSQAAGLFWHDLYQAAASLGRGRVLTAHGDLETCRIHLVNLYRLALAPDQAGCGWTGAELLPGSDVLNGLTDWLVCPLDLKAQWRCANRLATTYESLVLPLAERLGLDYPWAMRNLAFQRLEQVRPERQTMEEPGVPAPPEPEPPKGPVGPLRAKVKIRRPG